MSDKIIYMTQKEDGSFEANEDMNPYSEYVHQKAAVIKEPIKFDTVQRLPKPYSVEDTTHNINQLLQGVDVVKTVFSEVLKRFNGFSEEFEKFKP